VNSALGQSEDLFKKGHHAMRGYIKVLLGVALSAGLLWLSAEAIGQRFGGGRGGGGGAAAGIRAGGGGGAPMARPAPIQRPSVQPAPVNRGAVNGPYSGAISGGRQVGTATGPRGGAISGGRQVGTATGPRGGVAAGGSRGGSVTAPGGSTITGGSKGGVYTGPRGGVAVGGARGGTVTGPAGNTVSGGKAGGVVIGPNGNVHAGGAKGAAVMTPGGSVAVGSKGSVTTGPGGAVVSGGKAGIATGPGGTVAGAKKGAVAVGPYGAAAVGGKVVAGAGTAGRGFVGTRYVAAGDLRYQGGNVRRNFGYYQAFNPAWYRRYPGAWFTAGLITGSAWTAATWGACSSYLGYPATIAPVYYNYGDNVIYQDGNVYFGDQVYASEAAYAQQAAALADTGLQAHPAKEDQWQPLGVFALTKGSETVSNDIFELAINKDGVVRGNYYNAVSDTVTPVSGALDKKTQRVAWTIGDKKDRVFDTGLYNLTLEQTTVLVHFEDGHTEQYNLFRVEPPKEEQAAPPG
jgi:hypothetical protein